MEVLSATLVDIGKYLWRPLKAHVTYLIHFRDNIKDLKDKVEDLVAKRNDIQEKVRAGCSRREVETQEVILWQQRTFDILKEAQGIEQRVGENKKCLCCPNLRWRYQISKQAKEKAEIIARHRDQGKFDTLTIAPPPPPVINQEAPLIEGLASAELALKKVMDALRDEKIKIIGVWGMGGIGKTTLVKIVNNQMQGRKYFDKVIMVTISKEYNLKRVQADIMKRLGLIFEDKDESSRAIELREKLMQMKRFLIILDDLWETLDLADVGIPCVNDLVGCKIILTTRRELVCRNMETQVDIKVDLLSSGESWKLFKEKAGDVVDLPTVCTTAREVLKECGGLPLAIITLGRALRGVRNPEVWDNALSQLKKSAPSDVEGMTKVYQSIKISYECLRPELRPGFLFCSLFPEDYDIDVDRMIRYWKGEGFLEDAGSLEETINRGQSWVEELKASSLLLEGETEGFVKMHDVARDVAILIASKEEVGFKSFARTGAGLKGSLRGLNWEEYMRISLMQSRIDELPEGMHCPKLLTLMMAENKELSEIQGWFFEETEGLRVLDLSNTAISRLPISLSNLLSLRVLCLRYCRFGKMGFLSPLGGLKQLESLDLSYNDDLCELPVELGELINLRSLNLTYTSSLAIVPRGIISRLAHLEELKMMGSFSKWEVGVKEEEEARSSSNATLAEVASLAELSCLSLHIADLDRFPQDYAQLKSLEKLKKFHFYIYQSEYEMCAYTISLGFTNDSFRRIVLVGCIPITRWVNVILQRTTQIALFQSKGLRTLVEFGNLPSLQKIDLFNCDGMECVFSAREAPATCLQNHVVHSSSFPRMENLTRLLVRECDRVEHVFAGTPSALQDDVLPRLESLSLENLKNMRSIWAMGLVGSLQNLTHLEFHYCTALKKNALSSEQIKGGLPNLVELSVSGCYEIEEIISEVVDNEGLLPKLRVLRLYKLPELVRICGGNGEVPLPQLDWHSLQEIRVHRCPKLNKLLPLQRGAQGAPSLRDVRGEKEWWETLDWDEDNDIKAYFQPFFIEERAQWDSFGEATQQ